MGVHWLLLQTFSHVAGIQLKVLEAGDRSPQVGYDHFEGLAWFCQTTVSQKQRCRERERSLLTEVRVINTQRKGLDRRTDSTLDFSLSTCQGAQMEPHKTILPLGLDRKTERIRSGNRERVWVERDGGLGEDDMKE